MRSARSSIIRHFWGEQSPLPITLRNVARTFALSYEQLDESIALDSPALTTLAHAAIFAPAQRIPRHLLRAVDARPKVEDALLATLRSLFGQNHPDVEDLLFHLGVQHLDRAAYDDAYVR